MTTSFASFSLLILFILFSNCESNEPSQQHNYRINATLTIDGIERTFLLVLPPSYYEDEATSFSLVIGMHGTGGSATQFDRDYGLTQKANNAGFIVVYPEGIEREGRLKVRTWNAGKCCDFATENNIDDVTFISSLIDNLNTNYRVNPKRVYLTGMSNGGMLAYRLACELSEKIAAITAVSCSMVVDQLCIPLRSVPILHVHSVLDTKVPYNGGLGIGGYYFPPVDSVLNVWSEINNCKVSAEVVVNNSSYKLTRWSNCDADGQMECYLTQDGGHAWPGGQRARSNADIPSVAINATDVMWDFFQRYQLP